MCIRDRLHRGRPRPTKRTTWEGQSCSASLATSKIRAGKISSARPQGRPAHRASSIEFLGVLTENPECQPVPDTDRPVVRGENPDVGRVAGGSPGNSSPQRRRLDAGRPRRYSAGHELGDRRVQSRHGWPSREGRVVPLQRTDAGALTRHRLRGPLTGPRACTNGSSWMRIRADAAAGERGESVMRALPGGVLAPGLQRPDGFKSARCEILSWPEGPQGARCSSPSA